MRHHAVGAPEQEEQLRIDRVGTQPEMHHAINEAARPGAPQTQKTCISMRGIEGPELQQRPACLTGALTEARQCDQAARNQFVDERQTERSR